MARRSPKRGRAGVPRDLTKESSKGSAWAGGAPGSHGTLAPPPRSPPSPPPRAVHEEVVRLDLDFGAAYAGVLADTDGRVRALWASYSEQASRELAVFLCFCGQRG